MIQKIIIIFFAVMATFESAVAQKNSYIDSMIHAIKLHGKKYDRGIYHLNSDGSRLHLVTTDSGRISLIYKPAQGTYESMLGYELLSSDTFGNQEFLKQIIPIPNKKTLTPMRFGSRTEKKFVKLMGDEGIGYCPKCSINDNLIFKGDTITFKNSTFLFDQWKTLDQQYITKKTIKSIMRYFRRNKKHMINLNTFN